MAKTSDIVLAVAVVAGLGLLIYAGEQLSNWFSGAEKAFANWWGGSGGVQASGGLIPYVAKSAAYTTEKAISGMNYTLWNIPAGESQYQWAQQKYAEWGTAIEKDIGNWWSGVEKRLEKGLTTWW